LHILPEAAACLISNLTERVLAEEPGGGPCRLDELGIPFSLKIAVEIMGGP